MKSARIRWVGNLDRSRQENYSYGIIVGITLGIYPLEDKEGDGKVTLKLALGRGWWGG